MKLFILFISLFIGFIGLTQEITYRYSGTITNVDLGKKEAGVTVTVLKDGVKVASGISATNGKYDFSYNGPIGLKFQIEFSKQGLVSKKLTYDGSKMAEEDIPAGSEFPIAGDMSLFAERPGLDFSFLNNEPVATLFWDPAKFMVNFDKPAYDRMKKKIDDLLAKGPATADPNDAKYDEAVKAAEALFGQKKYQDALVKFELANSIKPKEKLPLDRIAEIDKIIQAAKKDQLAAQQADQEYLNLIKAADNLRDQKKFDDAIAKYTEASKKKPTEVYPTQQIAAVNKLKEDEKNKIANDKKFSDLVLAGDNALKSNKLDEAKLKYEEALSTKKDVIVQTKLDDVKKKLAEELAKNQNKAKYDGLIADGTKLFSESKLTEAKLKFIEAGKLDPTQTIPPAKIKEIDDLIAKNNADKQKIDKYNTTFSAAEQLMKEGKLKEAKAKFTEAQGIDPTKTEPKQKITEIDGLIAGQTAEADKKSKIDKLILEGNGLIAKNELDPAILKFEEVLKLDPSNTVAPLKITELKNKITALKGQAEKDKQFEALKTDGMKLASEKKWPEAKTKLEEANLLKLDPIVAAKLKEIDAAIKAQAASEQANKDKIDKYNASFSAADQLLKAGKLKEAKLKFTEAQTLDPTKAEPKQKIAEIDLLLTNQQAEADKKVKIDKLILEGNALFAKNEFDPAKAKYDEVIKLEPSNSIAQAKINEINTKLNALKGQAEKDKQFESLKAEGLKLAGEKKWLEAKSKLEEANTIKIDPIISSKIKEIDAAIKANDSQAQLEKEYTKLMDDAAALVTAKNYDGAIAKYKEASIKKPSEILPKTKISELDELKKTALNQAANDTKYNSLMAEGDKLVAAKNYLEAIKKFNEALKLKPSETAPVEKAKAAEDLEKEKGGEEKKNYEKIFTVVEKAIVEKDYAKAKGLIDRAKDLNKQLNVVPNDKRPDELLAKINALELIEKQYKEKITFAATAEKSKDYKRALLLYEEAQKLKPEETLPPQKIDELNKLLVQQSSEADQEKLYVESMNLGDKNMKERKYTEAISGFQKALSIKPNDAAAKAKLAEIQQIIDNEKAAKDNSIAKKAEFDKYIKEGDDAFKLKDYKTAKKSYELALTIIKDDKYATKQIIEIDRLLRELSSSETEAEYKKVIKEGDNLFKEKNYLQAKESYEKALGFKPKDAYALKKLKELDVILNTKIAEGDGKLKPLGEPLDKEITDGMAALNQAEIERKKLEGENLKKGTANVTNKEAQLGTLKEKEKLTATSDLFNVQTKIDAETSKKESNRKESVNSLSEIQKNNINEGEKNTGFEKSENLAVKEKINSFEIEKEIKEKTTLADDNGYEIKKYDNEKGNKEFNDSKRELEDNIASDQAVRNIQLKPILDPQNDDLQRQAAQSSIEYKDEKTIHDLTSGELKKANERQEATKLVDNENTVISQKEYENSLRPGELSESVKIMDKSVEDIQLEKGENDRLNSLEESKKVSVLVGKTAAEAVLKDENRQETTENLKPIEIKVTTDLTSRSTIDQNEGFSATKLVDNEVTVIQQKQYENSLRPGELSESVKTMDKSVEQIQSEKADKDRANSLDESKKVSVLVGKTAEEAILKDGLRQETTESLKPIEIKVTSDLTTKADADKNEGFSATKKVDDIQTVIKLTEVKQDNNRLNSVEVYKKNDNEIKTADFNKNKAEVEKVQSSKSSIESEKRKDDGKLAKANDRNSENVSVSKDIEKVVLVADQKRSDDNSSQIKNTGSAIHNVVTGISTESDKLTEGEKVNSSVMQDVTKAMGDEQRKSGDVQNDKHLKAQQDLNAKQKEPDAKPIVKNALGEQYPEGVSQESFTQKDEKGLMTTIITRRVVVIEGQGNVYVKTQTLQSITYNKNGSPTTEYVWQKETQGPNLKKNY